MGRVRAWLVRLGYLLLRRRRDAELRAELEAHVAMDTERGVRAGLSEEEARRRALIRLGGMQQTREAQHESAGWPWMESLLRDGRYGVRTLAKRPGVTAIAMISIALGIGANATVFSIVNRVVLRPVPVGDPGRLLALLTMQQGDNCCNPFPYPLYEDVRNGAKSFAGVAAYYDVIPASLGGNGEPERVWGQGVTPNFFDVAEMPMVVGRGFMANEETTPVVVLSERLWRRRFGADAGILGRAVMLSGHAFTVVGIVPGAFHSIEQVLDMEFWVPLGMAKELVPDVPPMDSREWHWLKVIARLRPGVDRAQAVAELQTLAQRLASAYPKTDKGLSFRVDQAGTLPPREQGGVMMFLAVLSVIPVLLLAIAGANVANLLLAQAAQRQRELAVRLALGATRARLRRQMLLESVLLGLGGGVGGGVLCLMATRGLSLLRLPAPLPLDTRVDLDWHGVVFTLLLSIVCGVLLGMGPAWAASRPRLANALRGENALAGTGRRLKPRNVLVVAQIAMSVVLLSMTVLFLRSLESAARIDIGFRTKGLLLLSMDPRLNGYTPERTSAFLAALRQRVMALPGVDAAVSTDVPLLSGGNRSDGFTIAGRTEKNSPFTYADLYMVTPGFFDAMGTPRLAGRDFANDRAGTERVAVVNQAFAERLFGHANPVGQRVSGGKWTYEIIGVVGNAKSRTVGEPARPLLYRSLDQSIGEDASLMGYTLVVHTQGNPAALAEAVRRQVFALDAGLAIYNEETMEEHVRTAYFLPRVAAMLFGVLGGMGLVLAAVGLYGVMSYAVSTRTREIGIRMALGAQAGSVERLVVRQGMVMAAVAVVLGWPAAWMLARMAGSFLYGVGVHDAVTFAAVPAVLGLVALAACWVPARRAAGVNPSEALRAE